MNKDISSYISQVDNLNFEPVSNETWETIQDEGLDEENDCFDRVSYQEATLKISDVDKLGLTTFDEKIVEKFNQFDIDLKDKYGLKYVDLISYDTGSVKIVKIEVKNE